MGTKQVMRFRYKPLSLSGRPKELFAKKGRLTRDALVLNVEEVPLESILLARRRPEKLMLIFDGDPVERTEFGWVRGNGPRLVDEINLRASAARAEAYRRQLQQQGYADAVRTVTCPACGCTVDLTCWPATPQAWCAYCDTLFTLDESDRPRGETLLGICPRCNLYARPVRYTFISVWLWLGVQRRYECTGCMGLETKKHLLLSCAFLWALPISLLQFVQSKLKGPGRTDFAGLEVGNRMLRRNTPLPAVEAYRAVLDMVGVSAGVRLNLAHALCELREEEKAVEQLQRALDEAGNYAPAQRMLVELLDGLGRTVEADELRARWEATHSVEALAGWEPLDVPEREVESLW